MKRLYSILIAVILLFTSISYPKTVNSQEIYNDPNQTYPIPTSQPREGALSESILGDSAVYTYPIEGLDLPGTTETGDVGEPVDLENPVPDSYNEPVSIIESFIDWL